MEIPKPDPSGFTKTVLVNTDIKAKCIQCSRLRSVGYNETFIEVEVTAGSKVKIGNPYCKCGCGGNKCPEHGVRHQFTHFNA